MTNPEDPNVEPTPPNLSKAPTAGADFPPPPAQPNFPPPPPPGVGYPPPPSAGFPSAPPPQPGYGYGQPAPMGSVPPGLRYDPASQLLIPDGTELASIGRRIGAFFLAIPLAIVTLGIGYVIWGLIVWGRGQTPALQVLGMRVWRPDTRRTASFGWMALREIVGRILDGILSIITELISFLLMVTGKERKTLHDLVAGTIVLYDPNKTLARR
jgi:uncharacterized RDD family membrane protein YckC